LEKYEKEIEQLLHTTGAKLLRRKRHEIYRLQSGGNFVQASTPSDWRRSRNSLGVLRRILKPHPDQDGNNAIVPAQPDTEPQKLHRSLPNWEPRARAESRFLRSAVIAGHKRKEIEIHSQSVVFTTWLMPLSFPRCGGRSTSVAGFACFLNSPAASQKPRSSRSGIAELPLSN
jgi:hypothetical protein